MEVELEDLHHAIDIKEDNSFIECQQDGNEVNYNLYLV